MSWLGILLVGVGLYLAYKLVGALLKVGMLVLALVGGYWFAAPLMDWPTVPELLGAGGAGDGDSRIGELVDPAGLARRATDRVVDSVLERTPGLLSPKPETPPLPEPLPLPDPLPEGQGVTGEPAPPR